jgi:hypothetical protein
MSLWKQWVKGFREYIATNKDNQYTIPLSLDDMTIIIVANASAGNNDRNATINEIKELITSNIADLDIKTLNVSKNSMFNTGTFEGAVEFNNRVGFNNGVQFNDAVQFNYTAEADNIKTQNIMFEDINENKAVLNSIFVNNGRFGYKDSRGEIIYLVGRE